jgi:hypothetical protein
MSSGNRPRAVVGEVDDDAALAVAAAAEIDVAKHVLLIGWRRFGKALDLLLPGLRHPGAAVRQRHHHGVAFDLRVERLRLVEAEHDARTLARLHELQAAQRGVVDGALVAGKAARRIEEIERDARRARDREAGRRVRRRRLQLEAHDGVARCAARDGHLLDRIRRLREGSARDEQGRDAREICDPSSACGEASRALPPTDAISAHFFCSCFWSACSRLSVLDRSDQSPDPSCTSSLSLISVSLMATTTPKFDPMWLPWRTW